MDCRARSVKLRRVSGQAESRWKAKTEGVEHMKAISVDELKRFSVGALERAGLSRTAAETATDVLVTTDTFGVLSHGTKNLYPYIEKMRAGGLDVRAQPIVEADGPSWAVINGNAALGMLSACEAMNLAVRKAKRTGIAYVGVKNSCHFGAAGYYANLAAQQGMIGLAMSNADPNMSIPNSRGVAIGNNPFSFAAPMQDGRSLFLDIALSNVAALKVVMAREKKESVPGSWLIDENGQPTTDPSGFPEHSHLQPMAAHKGYGLAMMVEILSSVLTGAGILSEVVSWNLRMSDKNQVGHAFIAIDISQIMPMPVFEERMRRMVSELKQAPLAKNASQIFVPGEMEWNKREKALRENRIELTEAMAENMERISRLYGLEPHFL
jgi:ureidoglycolate dehydrogenase (NAD+)